MAITEAGVKPQEDLTNFRDYGGMIVGCIARIPTKMLPEKPDEEVARANLPYYLTQRLGSLNVSSANSEY